MARSTYSVSGAQSQLPRLIKEAEAGDAIAISRRDVTVAYILSRDHLEAIVETMDILANPAARKAIEDHRAGRLRFVPLSRQRHARSPRVRRRVPALLDVAAAACMR